MFQRKRSLTLVMVMSMLLLIAAGCGKNNNASGGASSSPSPSASASASAPASSPAAGETGTPKSDKDPIVTIEMDTGKTIVLELYPDVAPNTVNNFISLVKKGFYDGTIFHRVMPGFMIQGGDPEGTGAGGPGYAIKGEFAINGIPNDLKHTRGVISMARRQQPLDSAGSQFFIMVADAPFLDGQYAAFGNVIAGMDTVDAIVNQAIDPNDPNGTMPAKPMAIKKATVDTKGQDYPEPEKIQP